ncbi:hypothetical protein, partial [Escherichia albertii]|uniref:hypothetical protein n=1 Tax=Escherichia albertii TaxID=208962 RepID=UPI001CA884A7
RLRTSFPNKTPAISKLELVLDIYPSLSLILRYIHCLAFQGAAQGSFSQENGRLTIQGHPVIHASTSQNIADKVSSLGDNSVLTQPT